VQDLRFWWGCRRGLQLFGAKTGRAEVKHDITRLVSSASFYV
jgi:hypothetical protein